MPRKVIEVKEYKKYYEEIIKTPPYAHIDDEADMDWLMTCLAGRIVENDTGKEIWYADGFIYTDIPGTGKALRVKQRIAERLCSFKCEFHKLLIDYLEERKAWED